MSVYLNMPGFSGGENSSTTKIGKHSCICCLVVNVPLVRLENCKHVEFFENTFEFKFEYAECSICYSCHGTLQDIYQFKRQVQNCLSNLNRQVKKQEQITLKLSKLTHADIEISHTQNSEPLAREIIKPTKYYEIKTEYIKTEVETESDHDYEAPLSEIKDGNDPNTPFYKYKHKDKFKLVTLSEKEMWEEREKEAAKEKYMKLHFKCESCIVGFDHEQGLKTHNEKRHTVTNGGFPCVICKSVLTTDASYKQHMRKHYRRVDCGSCGARYSTTMSAQAHYDKTHANCPTVYECSKIDCGFTTTSYRQLRYHRDSHKEKVQCDQCDKTFVNSSGLKVHMYTVHQASNRKYACAFCPKTYRQRSGLLSHAEAAHRAGARAAYCAPCKTHFRTKNNLKNHLNTHKNHINETDKRFVCAACDARFLTKRQLKEHVEWEHLKTIKHKCDECNKAFKSNSKLKRHINYVHEKVRPPRNKICDHCGRGFTTMAILSSHIRTHTGERPHACRHCPATFAHSAALYTHNKLLHTQKTAA